MSVEQSISGPENVSEAEAISGPENVNEAEAVIRGMKSTQS